MSPMSNRGLARLSTPTLTDPGVEGATSRDRIVMMTDGPSATIGEVLDVPLARPRRRMELASDRTYLKCREAVLKFYERHRFVEAAE